MRIINSDDSNDDGDGNIISENRIKSKKAVLGVIYGMCNTDVVFESYSVRERVNELSERESTRWIHVVWRFFARCGIPISGIHHVMMMLSLERKTSVGSKRIKKGVWGESSIKAKGLFEISCWRGIKRWTTQEYIHSISFWLNQHELLNDVTIIMIIIAVMLGCSIFLKREYNWAKTRLSVRQSRLQEKKVEARNHDMTP